ncbi:MAG TPA: hypothetical protein VMR33_02765 [Candidatus Baltobacteraceae bacterium]|jgi:hypothetical protein|nr:hypothetical protein [Candidatus Baltobacteraceae bacterium]
MRIKITVAAASACVSAILFFTPCVSDWVAGTASDFVAPLGPRKREMLENYIRLKLWKADARTLVAALRYLWQCANSSESSRSERPATWRETVTAPVRAAIPAQMSVPAPQGKYKIEGVTHE